MPYLSHNYRYQPKPKLKSIAEAALFILFSAIAIFITLMVLGWFSVSASQAAPGINQQINYQGKLTNNAGVQVADSNWNFRFRIYDASSSGNLLWTERWNATTTRIATVNGVFSAALGSLGQTDSLSAIDWNSNSLYLQVDLDADNNGSWEESFATRKRFTAASYAFNADEIDGIHATSTAAVANYLLSLDALGNLNLYGKGISSTVATTTEFVHIGTDMGSNVTNLDRKGGDLYVAGDSEFDGTVYFQGAVINSAAPTLYHTFSSWATGVANSNVDNSSLYINPAGAVTDSNLLGLAVNGSVRFLVDAEGDIFANNLTLAGSQNVGQSTISTLIVENNSYLGDANNADWTHIKGSLWVDGNKNAGTPSSTALVLSQQGNANYLEVVDGSQYYAGIRYFTITNAGVASSTQLVVSNNARINVLNATTTNIDTLLIYNDARVTGVLHATSTDLDHASTSDRLYVGNQLSVATSSPWAGMKLTVGGDIAFGRATTTDRIYVGGNATSTIQGNLEIVGNLGGGSPLDLTSDLIVYGNATTTGWFNVGTTNVVGTLGSLIGAGDLYVGSNATISNSLYVADTVGIKKTNPTSTVAIAGTLNVQNSTNDTSFLFVDDNTGSNISGVGIGTTDISQNTLLHLKRLYAGSGTNNPMLILEEDGSTGISVARMDRASAVRQSGIELSLNGTVEWALGQLYNGGGNALNFVIATSSTSVTNALFEIETDGDIVIGRGDLVGKDYSITFDGESNDGSFSWMEDENYFQFNDNVYISGNATTSGWLVVGSPGNWAVPTNTLTVVGSGLFTGNATTSGNLTVSGMLATGGAQPNSTTTANFGGNVLIQKNATTTLNLTVSDGIAVGGAKPASDKVMALDNLWTTSDVDSYGYYATSTIIKSLIDNDTDNDYGLYNQVTNKSVLRATLPGETSNLLTYAGYYKINDGISTTNDLGAFPGGWVYNYGTYSFIDDDKDWNGATGNFTNYGMYAQIDADPSIDDTIGWPLSYLNYGVYSDVNFDPGGSVPDGAYTYKTYGGYFNADGTSEGAHTGYGIYAEVDGQDTKYGGYLVVQDDGTTGYGLFIDQDENDTDDYGLYIDSESTALQGGGLYVLDGGVFFNENATTSGTLNVSTGDIVGANSESIYVGRTNNYITFNVGDENLSIYDSGSYPTLNSTDNVIEITSTTTIRQADLEVIGHMALGRTEGSPYVEASDGGIQDYILLSLNEQNNKTSGSLMGIRSALEATPSSNSSVDYYNIYGYTIPGTNVDFSGDIYGVKGYTQTYTAADGHFTGTLIGTSGAVDHRAAGTVDNAYALQASVWITDDGGTISNMAGLAVTTPINNGNIITAYGIKVDDQSVGTNTTAYGIYIGNQTGASGNAYGLYIAGADDYALYTIGNNYLNGSATSSNSINVDYTNSAAGTYRTSYINITDTSGATAGTQTNYGLYNNTTIAGTHYGSTPTKTSYGLYSLTTDTSVIALSAAGSTQSRYAIYGNITSSGTSGSAAATYSAYGGYFSVSASTAGAQGAYGMYSLATGGDNNYAGVFLSSGVGGPALVAATSTSYTIPTSVYAGWFKGNVMVTGQLYASGALGAAGGSDYAEYFQSTESLEAGDVVILDDSIGNHIKKSTTKSDQKAIGVVSTNPSILSGGKQGKNEDQLTREEMAGLGYYPIALLGQTPIKVTTQNGNIAIGDYITTSDTTGIGMKASDSTVGVVGIAQEAFPSTENPGTLNPATGYLEGKITILIKTAASLPDRLVVGTETTTSSTTPLTVIDNPDLDVQTLVVEQAATFYGTMYVVGEAGFEHKVVFADDVEIQGKLYVSADQAGTAIIKAGATSTEVVFEGEYEVIPKVAVSPQGARPIFYGIEDKSTTSFRIVLTEPFSENLSFDWIALAVKTDGEPPVIDNFITSLDQVGLNTPVELWARVSDQDTPENELIYSWEVSPNIGSIDGDSGLVYWTVAEAQNNTEVTITVTVSDGKHSVSGSKVITVLAEQDSPEEIVTEEQPVVEEPTSTPEVVEEPTVTTTEPVVILGCQDKTALNYNPLATQDDNSCTYPEPVVQEPSATTTEEIAQEEGETVGASSVGNN